MNPKYKLIIYINKDIYYMNSNILSWFLLTKESNIIFDESSFNIIVNNEIIGCYSKHGSIIYYKLNIDLEYNYNGDLFSVYNYNKNKLKYFYTNNYIAYNNKNNYRRIIDLKQKIYELHIIDVSKYYSLTNLKLIKKIYLFLYTYNYIFKHMYIYIIRKPYFRLNVEKCNIKNYKYIMLIY